MKYFFFGVLSVVLCFRPLDCPAQQNSNITIISSKQSLTRAFSSGERHIYKFLAEKNQAVEISVEQRGINIEMSVVRSGGERLIRFDSQTGWYGTENILFIAPVAGDYQIIVENALPGKVSGEYTIEIEAKNPATEKDKQRFAAFELASEADALARELLQIDAVRSNRSVAREKLEQAAELFGKANDLRGQAVVWFKHAVLMADEFGESNKAVVSFEKSLDFWRQAGDSSGEAETLVRAASEHFEIRENDQYQSYLDRSFALRNVNDRLGKSRGLYYQCRFRNNTGAFQKGFEACRESLELAGESDPVGVSFVYRMLGNLSSNVGNTKDAMFYYEKSLEKVRELRGFVHPVNEVGSLGNIGGIYARQKNYKKAIEFYKTALEISEKVERPLWAVYYVRALGDTYLELGQKEEAAEYLQRSLEIYRRLDPRRTQHALNSLGKIYASLNQPEQAEVFFTEALEVSRRYYDRLMEAETFYNLAQFEDGRGNFEKARNYLAPALKITEQMRLALLGDKTRTAFKSTVLEKFSELEIELLLKLHRQNPNGNHIEKAWQAQERIRARTLLEAVSESGFDARQYADKSVLDRDQKTLTAIAALENKRRQAASDTDRNQLDREIQELFNEYGAVQEEIRRANPNFAAFGDLSVASLGDAQKMLDAETIVLEYALGEKKSYVWVITDKNLKVFELAAREEINRAAIDFQTALSDFEAANETTRSAAAAKLGKLILAPIKDEIVAAKRLLIIPDGSLQLISFAALPAVNAQNFRAEPANPLVTQSEIVILPSVSSLMAMRKKFAGRTSGSQADRNNLAAVFADPVFIREDERFDSPKMAKADKISNDNLSQTLRDFGIGELARLPFSSFEGRGIVAISPENSRLIAGFDASRESFLRGDYNSYRILHFATHGFLNKRHPDLSGLVLSLYDKNRNPQNGFLRTIDLYSLRLKTNLVVLSACQSGAGETVESEGVLGLPRGFMYAGASSVLSSLWKIEDSATAEFMQIFYTALLKENLTPAAALRKAQLKFIAAKRRSSPKYWAAFVLQGEYEMRFGQ